MRFITKREAQLITKREAQLKTCIDLAQFITKREAQLTLPFFSHAAQLFLSHPS